MFLLIRFKETSYFIEWEIFNINGVSIVISIIADKISISFLSVVSLIAGFIIVYSIYYIEGDFNFIRFSFILLRFVTSMAFLIIRPNLISILLGWDGLGLTSYALVVYYQNESRSNSGMLTVLSNRVGDSAILLSIAAIIYKGRHNFIFMSGVDDIILLLIILASFTKRAQIPFSA